MSTYSIVIGTINRAPGPNYLLDCLQCLERAGVWRSPLLHQGTVDLVDGGSTSFEHLYTPAHTLLLDRHVLIHHTRCGQHANETFYDMAVTGSSTGAEWVITLEDDTLVCPQFLETVDAWRQAHAGLLDDVHVLPLYCPYPDLQHMQANGATAWWYPVQAFYGTQGLLWRAEDVQAYAQWYVTAMKPEGYWDILIKHFAQERWPETTNFLTPIPNFVQHVGTFSALGLHDRFHYSHAFAGAA